jgi:hypothetical protein
MTAAIRSVLTMFAPGTTFSDLVWTHTDDRNGTCAWHIAVEAATLHGPETLYDFRLDYGHLAGERIDTGELLVWLGY